MCKNIRQQEVVKREEKGKHVENLRNVKEKQKEEEKRENQENADDDKCLIIINSIKNL